MSGKNKRFGMHGYKRSSWKKAVVTLRAGESIEFYEGV
jgi:large subunit ribosomal protein L23